MPSGYLAIAMRALTLHALFASLASTSAFLAGGSRPIIEGSRPTRFASPRCSAGRKESELEFRKRMAKDPTYKAVYTPAKGPTLTSVSDSGYTTRNSKVPSGDSLPLPLLALGTAALALALVWSGVLSPEPPPPPPPGPLDYLPGALLVLVPVTAFAALAGSGPNEDNAAMAGQAAALAEVELAAAAPSTTSAEDAGDVEGVVVPFDWKAQAEGITTEMRQARADADKAS